MDKEVIHKQNQTKINERIINNNEKYNQNENVLYI